jgi:periplasmic copper chaperone A
VSAGKYRRAAVKPVHWRLTVKAALPAIAAILLCCAMPADAAGSGSNAQAIIRLDRPWSPATPNGAPTAAAYMSIENHGRNDDRLLGGSSPLAAKVEVHEMSMAGGIMSMHAVSGGLPIPAGQTVSLEPRANYHLMLSGLKSPLKNGGQLPLTLNFAKAGMVHVDVPILPIGSRGPAAPMPETMDHH